MTSVALMMTTIWAVPTLDSPSSIIVADSASAAPNCIIVNVVEWLGWTLGIH